MNPAARLLAILLQAQKEAEKATNNSYISQGLWVKVFEIGEQGPPPEPPQVLEVVSRLLQLQRLILETEESLRRIPDLPDMYFRPFERIRGLPATSLAGLNQNILPQIASISEGDMTVLEICSAKLEEWHVEPIVDQDELQEILQEVTAIFDDVKTSEIDPELKTFVLDGLESIRRGIHEFNIRGAKRLKEAIAEILASVMMNHEIVRSSEEQESIQKFNKTFSRFAAVVAFASNSVTLLTAFAGPLLGGGSPPPPASGN